MPFGQLVNLFPEVSILLPDFLQLCFGFGGRAARFEAQPGDDALFSTFGCHASFAIEEEVMQSSKEKQDPFLVLINQRITKQEFFSICVKSLMEHIIKSKCKLSTLNIMQASVLKKKQKKNKSAGIHHFEY